MPEIQAVGVRRQEHQKLKAAFVYRVSSKSAWAACDSYLRESYRVDRQKESYMCKVSAGESYLGNGSMGQ